MATLGGRASRLALGFAALALVVVAAVANPQVRHAALPLGLGFLLLAGIIAAVLLLQRREAVRLPSLQALRAADQPDGATEVVHAAFPAGRRSVDGSRPKVAYRTGARRLVLRHTAVCLVILSLPLGGLAFGLVGGPFRLVPVAYLAVGAALLAATRGPVVHRDELGQGTRLLLWGGSRRGVPLQLALLGLPALALGWSLAP